MIRFHKINTHLSKIFLLHLILFSTLSCSAEEISVPDSENDWHCPVEKGGRIIQGNHGKYSHSDVNNQFAWDYGIPSGTAIVAARSGVVVSCRTNSNIGGPDLRFIPDANKIVIKHSDGTTACYLHLSKNTNLVQEGEFVLQGERIGFSGDTGYAGKAHLHFCAHQGEKSVSIRFSDHRKNRGIPKETQFHRPPAKPVVSQEFIQSAKECRRAIQFAESQNWPAIAFALSRLSPELENYPEYYYSKILAEKQQSLSGQMKEKIKFLIDHPQLSNPQIVFMRRMKILASTGKPEKHLIKRLKNKEDQLPKTKHKYLDSIDASLRLIAYGQIMECMGKIDKSVKSYSGAVQQAKDELKKEALGHLQRVIREFCFRFSANMTRLKDESERCLNKHKKIIRKDAEKNVLLARLISGKWKAYFPEELVEVREFTTSIEIDFGIILKNTKN